MGNRRIPNIGIPPSFLGAAFRIRCIFCVLRSDATGERSAAPFFATSWLAFLRVHSFLWPPGYSYLLGCFGFGSLFITAEVTVSPPPSPHSFYLFYFYLYFSSGARFARPFSFAFLGIASARWERTDSWQNIPRREFIGHRRAVGAARLVF